MHVVNTRAKTKISARERESLAGDLVSLKNEGSRIEPGLEMSQSGDVELPVQPVATY